MTAKESLDDKGHGFELGADDYLTKPFYLEELKMRIQALLKRSGKFDQNTLLLVMFVSILLQIQPLWGIRSRASW